MARFSSETSVQGPVTLVYLTGAVDQNTSADLETALRGPVRAGARKLVIGMKDLGFMSSAGWGLLLSVVKEVRAGGGTVAVSAMAPEIRHVYHLLGMKAFVKEYANESDAVSAIG